MPSVTYVSYDGKSTTLDMPVGTSVMQAAVLNGVDGIVAECGGSCMCATCHVFVRESSAREAAGRWNSARTRCSTAPPARAAPTAGSPASWW